MKTCTEDYRTCTVHAAWKTAHAEEVNTRNALRAATGIDIYEESVDPDDSSLARAAVYARKESFRLAALCWCHEPDPQPKEPPATKGMNIEWLPRLTGLFAPTP